ncbi:hypothetical protein [Pelagovum pacificum]|uniref:hypothetical protein n=1 Tax=Pelagovum pacificum TaxID=2588711 RepID=UPI0018CF3365|nr:hypothetical protein [Pelagovum pacificum]QQA43877.1 hypothetical protein I8N54_04670 [Pelagovum pacificum]
MTEEPLSLETIRQRLAALGITLPSEDEDRALDAARKLSDLARSVRLSLPEADDA